MVMHMRRRGIKMTKETFFVNDEEIEVVAEYKYLGCVVNEQLNCSGWWRKGQKREPKP